MKTKRLHAFLIVLVFALTIYNILPTLIYYTKPLKGPVREKQAIKVAHEINQRVNELKKENITWIKAFCKLHKIQPKNIVVDEQDKSRIHVEFGNVNDAALFEKHLPRAGALIAFTPEQLGLLKRIENVVYIQRKIGTELNPDFFKYVAKDSEEYRKLVYERVERIVQALSEQSGLKSLIQVVSQNPSYHDKVMQLAADFNRMVEIYGNSEVTKRFLNAMQSQFGPGLAQMLLAAFEGQVSEVKAYLVKLQDKGDEQTIDVMQRRIDLLNKAAYLLQKNISEFKNSTVANRPLEIAYSLSENRIINNKQTISLGNFDVFVKAVTIDWEKERVTFALHEDVMREDNFAKEQLIMQHFAKLSQILGETVSSIENIYGVDLHQIKNTSGLLLIDLKKIALERSAQIRKLIEQLFTPEIIDKNKIVVVCPLIDEKSNAGFKKGSIYLLIKDGMDLFDKLQKNPRRKVSKSFLADLKQLSALLSAKDSIISYAGSSFALDKQFHRDYIFEIDQFYANLLNASREDFRSIFSSEYALLELSNLEQRLEMINRIETAKHEDLLRWRDDYKAALVDLDSHLQAFVPPPTKSPLWSNVLLSIKKYFRGDSKKILKWGLDLQGGKSVQIELRDQNGRIVNGEEEIKQAISELYTRVNRLGVSEVVIRKEGNKVVLDFPGSQALSAQDLIQGSSMTFHLVNEKFSSYNPELAVEVDRFLQEVWNEAVVSGKKELKEIQEIAYRYLGGQDAEPLTDSSRVLKKAGLILNGPNDMARSTFDDSISQIGILRGNDITKWQGRTHPLIILFYNFALEGGQLDGVQSGYSAMDGNYLGFSVKSAYTNKEGVKVSPRDELYNWTSHFSKEKVKGIKLGTYSGDKGWRMAIVLNERVVNAPHLEAALRSQGQITGNFTQREIHKLEADLKAGSLSFKPKILSEMNVSAQLGTKERNHSIAATIAALVGVVLIMVTYYRFSGIVASLAVIFNLLIIWAVYQNIGAAMSLASIAGVILTLGMAVDANVLVFERIREEYNKTSNLQNAISEGYKRAFSAIFDSNLTTILAALILLQFDSGPIKGFAVAIIIGIASSMFTALFVTRVFFLYWVQKPGKKKLSMAKAFVVKHFDFLKHSKKVIGLSVAIIVIGVAAFFVERKTIFGMDFTGGYAMTVQLDEEVKNGRSEIENALIQKGLKLTDFEVRTLDKHSARIYLSNHLDLKGQPFHELEKSDNKNAKIEWVATALAQAHIPLKETSIESMQQSFVQVSGQLSTTMKMQAAMGIAFALLGILLYIAFRFESKYALAAIICLIHDVLVTFGIIAIGRYLGLNLQIDLNTIAAIMTIVGYSLNDTIIIFDRLREDLKMHPNIPLRQAINSALCSTLSRTIMTSSTTLVVVVILTIFGGPTVFGFAFVMMVGIIFGTLSSLFLAGPALLFFSQKAKQVVSRGVEI